MGIEDGLFIWTSGQSCRGNGENLHTTCNGQGKCINASSGRHYGQYGLIGSRQKYGGRIGLG